MIIRAVIFCLLLLLGGCSSRAEKVYRVTQLQQASTDFMLQADRLRQLEAYQDALDMYRKAEYYALKRNDQPQLALSQLKQALIYLQLDDGDAAEKLIAQVTLANEIERLDLAQAISFVRVKLLLHHEEKPAAMQLLRQLENHYREDNEKHAYYQLVRWAQDYQQLERPVVIALIAGLEQRLLKKQLKNIEILSYAYFEDARWAVKHASLEQGRLIIEKALEHFSSLELTPKIARCLKFAADFYQHQQDKQRSDYYQRAYQKLAPEREENTHIDHRSTVVN